MQFKIRWLILLLGLVLSSPMEAFGRVVDSPPPHSSEKVAQAFPPVAFFIVSGRRPDGMNNSSEVLSALVQQARHSSEAGSRSAPATQTKQQGDVAFSQSSSADVPSASARSEREERRRLARQYSRGWYWFYFINQAYVWLVLWLMIWTGWSARVRHWISRLMPWRWGVVPMYAAVFILLMSALLFPFDWFVFWRETRYGFANQSFAEWLSDWFKQLAVMLVFGLPVVWIIYTVFERAPRRWWLWGSGVLIGWVIIVVAIAPVFITPLFNRFEPVKDPALRQRILALAHQHQIPADDVYQMDASRQSHHTNAYVIGLWDTQRIVLYDTLLERFTAEEIEFVMAHEMGHYKLHHIWKGIGLAALAILVGMWFLHRMTPQLIERYQRRFGFNQLADVASLPLLLLLVAMLTFVVAPLTNGISRRMEHQADVFALRVAPHPEAALSVFEKFETLDLSEADPPLLIEFWLYTHPSLKRRIETAKQFLAQPASQR
ncbi:MAG: M48 family metallopeptidase [Acidobacteriota bacterium]|nr:M48 family metallopeptidase [Acidobacteriota bacterium]